jgi:prolyl-tRNA editing enzyme YbaK/EbsC (Cys-tRNA(Pro) deacylase)
MSPAMEYLEGRGTPFMVLPHPQAETVFDTARRHGFPTAEVVRTVVITTRYGNALVVVRADREVVEELVVAALGDEEVGVTAERDLLRNYPDYEPGSIPPLGPFLQAPMYVDTEVARRVSVVFAAGRPSLAIRMLTKDLFHDAPVVITPLTRESREEEERLQAEDVTVVEPGLAVTEHLAQDEPAE